MIFLLCKECNELLSFTLRDCPKCHSNIHNFNNYYEVDETYAKCVDDVRYNNKYFVVKLEDLTPEQLASIKVFELGSKIEHYAPPSYIISWKIEVH